VKRSIALFMVCCLTLVPRVSPAADAPAAKPAASAAAAPAVVDSLGMLERAVAKDSTKFDNLYRLGVMYLDKDRTAEAARVFAKASQLKPKDVRTLVNLGAAYDASGNAVLAQDYYSKALAISPNDSVATCRLASSIYAQASPTDPAKYQKAVDLLRDVIKRRPTAYCAYFTLGVAFADAGLYRDAIRMWRKVVDLAPGTPEAVSSTESIEVLEKFVTK
jgi:cytochrome c-type biogenesis protein CcmH/NrfG